MSQNQMDEIQVPCIDRAARCAKVSADLEQCRKPRQVLGRQPHRVVVGLWQGLHHVPMFGHLALCIEAHEVGDDRGRQQLVQDDEITASEQVNGSPYQSARTLPCHLLEVMAQAISPLADARRVLDVVFGHIAIDQTHVVAVHAVGHEVQQSGFIGAQVIA